MTSLRLGLIGQGIAHSLSPVIHEAALQACGLQGEYVIYDTAPSDLSVQLERVRCGDLDGVNITIPYKRAAAELCDVLRGDAVVTGAVNTVWREEGGLVGDSTDARGLEAAVRGMGAVGVRGRAGADESGQSAVSVPGGDGTALVIGAGGAAAAAVLVLSRLGVGHVTVCCRDERRMGGMVERMGSVAAPAWVGWDVVDVAPVARGAGVVVNATPCGAGELPIDVGELRDDATVIDLRYQPRPVDLVVGARGRGLAAQDGVEMLLRQGLLSFELWTGCRAEIATVRAVLAEYLAET